MEEINKDKISSLLKLKEKYLEFKKKYNLPEFSFLNENFEIEGLEIEETDLLLKRIRKQIVEKIYYNSRTLETFMNPQSAPLFVFSIVKGFSPEDNILIKGLYKELVEFEIDAFGLEASYEEKREADFIKRIAEAWPSISDNLVKIGLAMKINYSLESKKDKKSYLG